MTRPSLPLPLAAPTFLWITGLLVIPCIALLLQSFYPDGVGPTTETYVDLWNSRAVADAFQRSIVVSVWVTFLTVMAGYPLALTISRVGPVMRSVLLAIVIFPFLLSAVVRAYGWTVILGENGVINDALSGIGLISEPLQMLQNTFAIVVGETHVLLPYMVLSLLAVIRRIDQNLEAAAMSLGAPPHVVFTKVVLPMTLPGLLTGMLLVFSLAMTAFATPFLLGGARAPILTVQLYKYAFTLFDWAKASAVAGVLLLMGLAFVALHRWVSRRLLAEERVAE